MTPERIRARIAELRQLVANEQHAAINHYKWATHCDADEIILWLEAGWRADDRAMSIEKRITMLEQHLAAIDPSGAQSDVSPDWSPYYCQNCGHHDDESGFISDTPGVAYTCPQCGLSDSVFPGA